MACCARCDAVLLQGGRSDPSQTAFCFALAALLLFVPAYRWPILEVTTFGRVRSYTVLSGTEALWQGGMWPLAIPVALASVVLPAGLVLVLLALSGARQLRIDAAALRSWRRLCDVLRAWAIVDVYLLAIFITVVKLAQLDQRGADAGVGPALRHGDLPDARPAQPRCRGPRSRAQSGPRPGWQQPAAARQRYPNLRACAWRPDPVRAGQRLPDAHRERPRLDPDRHRVRWRGRSLAGRDVAARDHRGLRQPADPVLQDHRPDVPDRHAGVGRPTGMPGRACTSSSRGSAAGRCSTST